MCVGGLRSDLEPRVADGGFASHIASSAAAVGDVCVVCCVFCHDVGRVVGLWIWMVQGDIKEICAGVRLLYTPAHITPQVPGRST